MNAQMPFTRKGSNLKIVEMKLADLIPNKLNSELYGDPAKNEALAMLRQSMKLVGLKVPLIATKSGKMKDGDLRRIILMEMGETTAPCIIETEFEALELLKEKNNIDTEILEKYKTIIYDLKKKETVFSKIIRNDVFNMIHGDLQGKRSDKDADTKKAMDERKQIAPKSGITKLNKIRDLVEEAFPGDRDSQDEWLLSHGPKATIKTVLKDAERLAAKTKGGPDETKRFDYIVNEINVYNQTCLDLSHIPDKSVQVVGGSPAFYNMRVSQGFENELGRQNTVAEFVSLLVQHYKQCERILTDDGCIWVNIADVIRNSCYMLTTEKFIIAMDEAGIKLKDRIYWVKASSQPGDGDGSLGNVELLLKFSFCKNPYTDYTWLNDIAQKEDLKYGEGQRVRLSSFLNLKDGIVKTNIANTARLRKVCKKHGFYLEHTSTYPIEIPCVFLMTSCREDSHFIDLHNGTGTSGKAVLILNSEFKKKIVYHGFEINTLSVHSTKVNIEMDFGEQPSDNTIPFYPKQDNETPKAA